MCSILNKTDKNIEKYLEIKKKIKNNIDNPTLNIINFTLPDSRKINVFQDGDLIAGTKQRVAKKFVKKIIKNTNTKIIVYAGSYNGYGAIATAYAAYKLNLKSIVFLSSIPTDTEYKTSNFNDIINSKQINTLHALKSKIFLCPDYRTARTNEYELTTIEVEKNKWIVKDEYMIIPMGLNDNNGLMIKMLKYQIRKALINTNVNYKDKINIWLVAGTGGISESVSKAFPNAKLNILFTGGGKYKKQAMIIAKKNKNINILKNIPELENYNARNDRKLYYESTSGYDDRIWGYVIKYGKDNDYIWNVGCD